MVKITPIPYSERGPTVGELKRRDPCLEPRKPEHPTIRWLGSGPARLGSPTQGLLIDVLAPHTPQQVPHEAEIMDFNNDTPRLIYGWKIDIEAPPSVSILWGAGSKSVRADMLAVHQKGVEETLRQIERLSVFNGDAASYGVCFATKSRGVDENFNPRLKEECVLLGVQVGLDKTCSLLFPPKQALSERQADLNYNLAMMGELDRRCGWVTLEKSEGGLRFGGIPEAVQREFSRPPFAEEFRGFQGKPSSQIRPEHLRGDQFFASWRERAEKHGWSERDTESFLNRKTEQAPSQRFGQSESRSGKSETRPQGPKTQSKDQSHSR